MDRIGVLVAGLLVACAACVTESYVPLEPAASKIKLVRDESEKPLRCKALADVTGRARMRAENKAREGAENALRNEAANYKGANYVLVKVSRAEPAGTSPFREAFASGKALACQEDEGADTPGAPAPASSP